MQSARPLPTVIGPAENALRALLVKILSNTRIKTYEAWVTLNAGSNPNATASSGAWQLAVADALKVDMAEVEGVLAHLRAQGLIGSDGSLTGLGAAELATARSAVSAATHRLVDGIGEDEQATARRVLNHVRQKAEELLHQ